MGISMCSGCSGGWDDVDIEAEWQGQDDAGTDAERTHEVGGSAEHYGINWLFLGLMLIYFALLTVIGLFALRFIRGL